LEEKKMQNMIGRKICMSGSGEEGVFLGWNQETGTYSTSTQSLVTAIIEFKDGEIRTLSLDSFYFIETLEEYLVRLVEMSTRAGIQVAQNIENDK
jgi:hypothetical protein